MHADLKREWPWYISDFMRHPQPHSSQSGAVKDQVSGGRYVILRLFSRMGVLDEPTRALVKA
jgi:hypothetical protein